MNVTFETFRGTEEGKIVAGTTTRTLGPSEVHIETTHSGLCGTDELYVKAGICLGHEGIGIVCQTGSAVSSVKVGDRVGFGYTHYVCGTCDTCLSGQYWLDYSKWKDLLTTKHRMGSALRE